MNTWFGNFTLRPEDVYRRPSSPTHPDTDAQIHAKPKKDKPPRRRIMSRTRGRETPPRK